MFWVIKSSENYWYSLVCYINQSLHKVSAYESACANKNHFLCLQQWSSPVSSPNHHTAVARCSVDSNVRIKHAPYRHRYPAVRRISSRLSDLHSVEKFTITFPSSARGEHNSSLHLPSSCINPSVAVFCGVWPAAICAIHIFPRSVIRRS